MNEELFPLDTVNGTYLVDPTSIVKIVPYGTGCKVYTYETFGNAYAHESIGYKLEVEPIEVVSKLPHMSILKFGIEAYLNRDYITASDGCIVKHILGVDTVHARYSVRLGMLAKSDLGIIDLNKGMPGDNVNACRLLP